MFFITNKAKFQLEFSYIMSIPLQFGGKVNKKNCIFAFRKRKSKKMKKTVSLILMVICLIAIAVPAAAKKKGQADITFAQTTYDFGVIPEKKGVVSHEFVFTNTGDKPLVIQTVTAECGCTTPEYSEAPVAPGKSGKIKVTYNPLGRPGGFTKKVTVRTNGKTRKSYLYVKGVVNPNKK